MFDQALAYIENATKLVSTIPDAGYQFTAQELPSPVGRAGDQVSQFGNGAGLVDRVFTFGLERKRARVSIWRRLRKCFAFVMKF